MSLTEHAEKLKRKLNADNIFIMSEAKVGYSINPGGGKMKLVDLIEQLKDVVGVNSIFTQYSNKEARLLVRVLCRYYNTIGVSSTVDAEMQKVTLRRKTGGFCLEIVFTQVTDKTWMEVASALGEYIFASGTMLDREEYSGNIYVNNAVVATRTGLRLGYAWVDPDGGETTSANIESCVCSIIREAINSKGPIIDILLELTLNNSTDMSMYFKHTGNAIYNVEFCNTVFDRCLALNLLPAKADDNNNALHLALQNSTEYDEYIKSRETHRNNAAIELCKNLQDTSQVLINLLQNK